MMMMMVIEMECWGSVYRIDFFSGTVRFFGFVELYRK